MGLARQSGARMIIRFNLDYGPLGGMTPNALYSFFTPGSFMASCVWRGQELVRLNGCK